MKKWWLAVSARREVADPGDGLLGCRSSVFELSPIVAEKSSERRESGRR
jgi:hypothetical protein